MKKLIFSTLLIILTSFIFLWFAGWNLSKPVNKEVGNCPKDLNCENVEFNSKSNSLIKGWLVKGESGKGIVVLMHGVRSNRSDMIERIKFLNKRGFSVFAFDFQSHGESIGEAITFGYKERFDSDAAVDFLKDKFPNEKIGVIGISMGGAAFLLSENKNKINAVVLELVYPTFQKAVENRLNLWLFSGADLLTPLMTYQMKPRLGFSVDDLRPIDKVSDLEIPKLFIVGEKDVHTTLTESKQLYEASNLPKELWIVKEAEHEDIHKHAPQPYEQKIVEFFEKYLDE